MNFMQVRARVRALTLAFIGVVFMIVNHRTITGERNYYPMLLLFGPVCILFGLVGAIEPRILIQRGAQANDNPPLFRWLAIILVLVGLAIGWAIAYFYYGIWKSPPPDHFPIVK